MSNDGNVQLDQRMLDQFRMLESAGRPGMLAQMIGMFLRGSADQIAAIVAAGKAGDAEKLRVTSHTMKSNAASFGATALADACKDIEYAARNGRGILASEDIANLSALHQRTCEALQREIV